MTQYKLIQYDLRFGLLRYRYLLLPVAFIPSCIQCYTLLSPSGVKDTWIDYLIYCFAGMSDVHTALTTNDFHLPIFWILQIGIFLYVHLDYILLDLSGPGIQIIVRSVQRRSWFASKCLWNLLSTIFSFLVAWSTIFLCAVCAGAQASPYFTDAICIFQFPAPSLLPNSGCTFLFCPPTAFRILIVPLLTFAALNMLQMVLSLLMKPILAFLICLCLPVIALLWNSPLILGNGAVLLRSDLFAIDGNNSQLMAAISLATIIICGAIGNLRFQKYDIFSRED